jgi:signal transduction histidine kinase
MFTVMNLITADEIDKALEQISAGNKPLDEQLQTVADLHQRALEINYPLGVAATNALHGKLLTKNGQFTEAVDILEKAREQLVRLPFTKWHVVLHNGYAEFFRNLGAYEQVFEHYLVALDIAQTINNEQQIIASLGNIGNVHLELGQYDKSIESHLQVLEKTKDTNNKHLKFSVYINLMNAYHFAGKKQDALDMAQRALALAETDMDFLHAHGNLGVAYSEIGEHTQAKVHLEKSLELAQQLNLEQSRCVCLIDLANFHTNLHEDDEAQRLLLEALTIADALDYRPKQKECHQRLHSIYRQQENWERALYHHEQMHQLDKAMFNDRTDARIRNLETLHKVEQLRQTNEQQKYEHALLTQVKDDLLSNVSHDLKNPLTAIRATLYVAQRTLARDLGKDNLYHTYFERIYAQVDQMTYLITDVLDTARFSVGMELDLQVIDIRTLLTTLCAEFQTQTQAKNINLKHTSDTPIYALADERAMHRVLMNLISNAVKFTPEGGHIAIDSKPLDDHRIAIHIQDNGIGIPEEELPHIFERFYRVPAHQETSKGTGLGLSIVKSIVEQHHGEIVVESEPQQGTTFTITLPSA